MMHAMTRKHGKMVHDTLKNRPQTRTKLYAQDLYLQIHELAIYLLLNDDSYYIIYMYACPVSENKFLIKL